MTNSMLEQIREIVKKAKNELGTQQALAELAGVSQPQIQRFLNDGKDWYLSSGCKVLEALGYKIIRPDERPPSGRDVQFVDAKIVSTTEEAQPPQAENYIAVPLVAQSGAGPGLIPNDRIVSWVLIYAQHHSVMHRLKADFLAIEVDRDSDSMEPLISPFDTVLIDRNDFIPQPDGRGIYLVMEPGQVRGGKIKRVQVHRVKGETQIVFYSDNKKYGPETPRLLDTDYGDNWANAILGRCVWAWSDLTRK